MAYAKKAVADAAASSNDTVTETVTEVKKQRVFKQDDLIKCRSIVSGGLYINGSRSGMLYTWADCGDIMEVEYRDLVYMVRTRADKSIYEPRIIVEDEDFIEQNPNLKEFYDSMYTTSDFREIIAMPIAQMKKNIESLPAGAKNAVKGIVATMIDDRSLDSVKKIKALDEIFGTNMLLTLTQE